MLDQEFKVGDIVQLNGDGISMWSMTTTCCDAFVPFKCNPNSWIAVSNGGHIDPSPGAIFESMPWNSRDRNSVVTKDRTADPRGRGRGSQGPERVELRSERPAQRALAAQHGKNAA
jgi:hypothetical protein